VNFSFNHKPEDDVHELDTGPSRDPTVETPKMKYRSLRSDPLMRVGGLDIAAQGPSDDFFDCDSRDGCVRVVE